MAQHWKDVNLFRLFVVVGLSLATSATVYFGDSVLTGAEIFNGVLQASIAGFAFLQCPEIGQKKKGEKENGTA